MMKKKENLNQFELCDVCRRNHNQGRRHRYSASHQRALSALLSKFRSKFTMVQSSLRQPTFPAPDLSSWDRIWCIFCSVDVLETGAEFTCCNAINHFGSMEHLRNVREFFVKHGGGMDQVGSFTVSEEDFNKWEKACTVLKNAGSTSGEGTSKPLPLEAKDIHNELCSDNIDNFNKHYISSFTSNNFLPVVPLQKLTDEDYRVYPHAVSSESNGLHGKMGSHAIGTSGINITGKQYMQFGNKELFSNGLSQTNGLDCQSASGGDYSNVSQKFTRISRLSVASQSNIHSGSLPPWLDASEQINLQNSGLHANKLTLSSTETIKLKKLNPKRVGAAWADRRRAELEMEKKGEKNPSDIDANWLPNFGRVWQTGTRKESKKEFETEKKELLKDNSQPEPSIDATIHKQKDAYELFCQRPMSLLLSDDQKQFYVPIGFRARPARQSNRTTPSRGATVEEDQE